MAGVALRRIVSRLPELKASSHARSGRDQSSPAPCVQQTRVDAKPPGARWLEPRLPLPPVHEGHALGPERLQAPALFEHAASVKPSSRGEYEIPDAITAMLAAELRVYAFPLQGFWTDVGTPEDLARAEALLTRTS